MQGEKALDAISEARARDRALDEARARAVSRLTYDSATDATVNPFSTDDEGMEKVKLQKERAMTRKHHKRELDSKNKKCIGRPWNV